MRVGVILDAPVLKGRLDLPALAERLSDKDTIVRFLDGLAASDLRAVIRADGLEGMVVAGRDQERMRASAEAALQAAGADRFAARAVDLSALCASVHPPAEATGKAGALLAAAIGMVRQYRWLRPANIRLRLGYDGQRLSRRALLALPVLGYQVVPAVNQARCVAFRGCNLCLEACPVGAISIDSGAAHIEKERCRDCGLCLAACSIGAVEHPFYSRRAMDAGLTGLLTASPRANGGKMVAFACPVGMELLREAGRQRLSYPASILPLEVPCAGFVDWYLVLRALDLGASAVTLVACGPACRCGGSLQSVESRISCIGRLLDRWAVGSARLSITSGASARQLVARLNALAEAIAALPEQPLSQGPPSPVELHRYRLARLLTAMSRRLGIGDDITLEDECLPFGQARLNLGKCSLCGLCADGCPTGALTYGEDGGKARLLFAAAECVGCELCAAACPEAALTIERRLELSPLRSGAQALKAAELVHCRRCGQPFAPEAMLSTVLHRLGGRRPSAVTRYCPDCRMIAGPAG